MPPRNTTMLALIYLIFILAATLYPFEFAAGSWAAAQQKLAGFFAFSDRRDFLLNIVLFLPLGFLLFRLLNSVQRTSSAIVIAAIVGAGTSLVIELLQVFFHRDPSAFDVVANMLGTGAGAILAALLPRRLAEAGGRCWGRLERSGAVLALAVLYGAIPLILSAAQFAAPFGVWNPRFTLQLGNEPTLDRPWLGKIHFVALYNRALSAGEIRSRYQGGPAATVPTEGVMSLYTFDEGGGEIVHDRSGVRPALDLSFEPSGRVRWLDGADGVEIIRPAVLTSREPARKLAAASRATGELSIEAWVTPRHTLQRGPARIVSFSGHRGTRNFTLGQQGSSIEFRLRTPVTGRNGLPLALSGANGIAASEKAHVVATYKDGVERLYINGSEQPRSVDLPNESIIGFGTGRTLPASAAYALFYFFPAAFFAAGFFALRANGAVRAVLFPAMIAAGLLIAAELFQISAFHRSVDFHLVGFGLLAAGLGAAAARRQVEAGKQVEVQV